MWRILRLECGIKFATPNLPVYDDRLICPGRPARVGSFTAAAHVSRLPGRVLRHGRPPRNDEQRYQTIERIAADLGAHLEKTWPIHRVEQTVRATVPYGPIVGENFLRERDIPALTLSGVRSLPAPSPVAATAYFLPASSRLAIRELRAFQHWTGLLMLLPTEPLTYGFIQLVTPEVQAVFDYDIPFDGGTFNFYPPLVMLDALTEASAAVMSMFLDRGVLFSP